MSPSDPRAAALRSTSSRAAPALVAAAALSATFVGLTLLVTLGWPVLRSLDDRSLVHLRHVDAHSALYLSAMRLVSVVVSTTAWVIVLGSVTVWLVTKRLHPLAAFVAVTALGSPILNRVLKELVHRPRPVLSRPVETAGGWSFPSGHVQAATVGCAVLLVVFLPALGRTASRWAVAAAVSVTLLVAWSRMSLGVHYPSDVVAAVLAGSAWTSFTAWAFLRPAEGSKSVAGG